MGPGLASLKGNETACAQLSLEFKALDEQFLALEKLVCTKCSGFGHTSRDFRNGPSLIGKKFCPTVDVLDVVVEAGLVDRKRYIRFLHPKPELVS